MNNLLTLMTAAMIMNNTPPNTDIPSLTHDTHDTYDTYNTQSHKSVIHERQVSNVPRQQSGFTLIEIMVVIVILAILAGLVVPRVLGQADSARVGTTETALSTVSNALDMYKLSNSQYPTTAQGLDALITPPADAKNYPEGGYLKGGEYPTDSWDNELQYVIPGSEGRMYDLFSLGADGQQGGEGLDADLYANP